MVGGKDLAADYSDNKAEKAIRKSLVTTSGIVQRRYSAGDDENGDLLVLLPTDAKCK